MRKLLVPLLIAALLVGAFAVSVDAQTFYQKFENIWAKTLLTTGNAIVGGDLTVGGTVNFDTSASTNLESTGDTTVGENLTVSGTSNLIGAVTAGGALGVTGATSLAGLTTSGAAVIAGASTVTGTSNLVGNVNAGGTLNVVGAATMASLSVTGTTGLIGNTDVTGNLEVTDFIGNSGQEYYFPGDAVTVLSGGIITPTTALVELTAAGTVGTSLSNPCTEGQFAMLVNTANQTITITDTGTTKLAGDWVGGQDDTLTLTCVGVSWYEMGRAAN